MTMSCDVFLGVHTYLIKLRFHINFLTLILGKGVTPGTGGSGIRGQVTATETMTGKEEPAPEEGRNMSSKGGGGYYDRDIKTSSRRRYKLVR